MRYTIQQVVGSADEFAVWDNRWSAPLNRKTWDQSLAQHIADHLNAETEGETKGEITSSKGQVSASSKEDPSTD